MRDRHPLILDRDADLAALTAAVVAAAGGHGTLILMHGPAGSGRTTMVRAAGAEAAARGVRTLTARGLALEQGFPYGIVRQLLEPTRAAAGPAEWDALLDGAARSAGRVLDGAEAGNTAEVPHAIVHGLYWLTANLAALAARGPLLLAVDDAHWADAPSLRWLSHLAARIDRLPVLLVLAARSGPDQPEVISELGAYPGSVQLELRPLGPPASAALVRAAVGGQAGPEVGRAAHASTGGNPFLLDALINAVRPQGGAGLDEATVLSAGPPSVADAVARRTGQLGPGAAALTRALAVLGRPASLRHVAALAEMDLGQAALLTDRLRAASVLAAGALLEFEHPIVRTAIYNSVPPGMRAMAHARAAAVLAADSAGAELVGLHLLRSEPAADPDAVTALRAAASSASGRGAPGTAAGFLRRALAEPPPAETRSALLFDLGLALARDRDESAVTMLHEAVSQSGDNAPPGRAKAALLSAGALGVWGHHDRARGAALAGLAAASADPLSADPLSADPLVADQLSADPLVADQLEAELFANSWVNAATARSAWDRIRPRLDAVTGEPPAGPGMTDWRVYQALAATVAARRGSEVMDRLAPALAEGAALVNRDSLCGLIAVLVLIWNDELERALTVSGAVLADARARGSMSMITSVRCLRSMILRRLGRLREAADDGRAGLDFKLTTAPPLSVAWAAAFLIEALTKIGRFAEAEDVVTVAEDRRPPDGWIHSVMFIQARGTLRVASQRPAEGLADLRRAAEGWRALGVSSPAGATWRIPAVVACTALGRRDEAARLAAEQLELARAAGTPATLGVSLRIAAPFAPDPERYLAEAISLLDAVDGRYEQGLALAELGAHRRRAGRRGDAREPLRRALDYAERTGAERLRGYARAELLAVGARPRRAALTGPDALTRAEREVAVLAAEGRSNRQIAQQLYITRATVETHLRHAFRKLGIRSRSDLAARLARGRE